MRMSVRRARPTRLALALVALLLLAHQALTAGQLPRALAAPRLLYVDADATGANDGSSWEHAFASLNDALATAASGDEVWVAAGAYTPGLERTDSFALAGGVAIYGGFAGGETQRDQRDWQANRTILSGEIGVQGDTSDNSYHVVTSRSVDATAILDGFTITGGRANDVGYPDSNGAGMFNEGASPTIRRILFVDNAATWEGGGMFNYAGSAPILSELTFVRNSAYHGGGLANFSSDPTLFNISFNGNQARQGGGMYNDTSAALLGNAVFAGNHADQGSAIFNRLSQPALYQLTVAGSMQSDAASQPTVQNSMFWSNAGAAIVGPTAGVRFSLIAGGYNGPGNIAADPQVFRMPAPGADQRWGTLDDDYGDLRPRTGSPAIDAGDTTAVLSDAADLDWDGDVVERLPLDLDGEPRVLATINIGAYESIASYNYVNSEATGANNGTSWSDAYTRLEDALAAAKRGAQIWVAAGTYRLGQPRATGFVVRNDVALYGGFQGGETELAQRDWQTHRSILSGDSGAAGDPRDNSYHVLVADHTTTILDGFTIVGGQADDSAHPLDRGGGLLDDQSDLLIRNVVFAGNRAVRGGGIFSSGRLALVNVVILGNRADQGGAVFSQAAELAIVNSTLSANTAASKGGGLYNQNSAITIANSILWGNSAPRGGQIFNLVSLANARFSTVEGGYAGTGNLSADPLFVDASGPDSTPGTLDDDLRLRSGSPAIDSGSNSALPSDIVDLDGDGITAEPLSLDAAGRPRRFDVPQAPDTGSTAPIVDMGAYETPVIYVNPAAGPARDGLSWASAYADLQPALDAARRGAGVAILVAEGTYRPGANRTDSFELVDGVPLYGGFAGSEIRLEQRDWRRHVTTLSGDIGAPGDMGDNSYHVVTSRVVGAPTILDGFTIAGGNADSDSFPQNSGGGLFSEGGSLILNNMALLGNTAADGGGLYSSDGAPRINNTIFSGNTAFAQGGALYAHAGDPLLTNVSFSENQASVGGAIYGNTAHPQVRNSIVWGNGAAPIAGASADVAYSLVEGGYGGVGNLDADPRFVDADGADDTRGTFDDDLRLRAGSPAIDAGDNAAVPLESASDFAGAPRFVDDLDIADTGRGAAPIVDIGAYEYRPVALASAPSNLVATPTSRMGIALTWMEDTDNEAGFIVERSPNGTTGWSEVGRTKPNVVTYDDRGLKCNTTYFYRVRSYNAQINWPFSNVTSALTGECVPTTIYVKADAAGANDGRSWASAYIDLQDALAATIAGDEVWVAAGTYRPTRGGDRRISFRLTSGVGLYGGFKGHETDRAQRDWQANIAVLSGDIGREESANDNTYNVVAITGAISTTVLDGFTISGGNADRPEDGVTCGGGIANYNGRPTLRNLVVSNNRAYSCGGGMSNSIGYPKLSNVVFRGNSTWQGGGLYSGAHEVELDHVSFVDNSATYGAGLFGHYSRMTLRHVIFSNNRAGSLGGGMNVETGSIVTLNDVIFFRNSSQISGGGLGFFDASDVTLNRVIFAGNSSRDGGAIFISNSSPNFYNVLFNGNSAIDLGGAIFNGWNGTRPTLTNVTFAGNSAGSGGAMYNMYSGPIIRNSIFWGNTGAPIADDTATTSVSYSLVEGGYPGAGNLSASPLLADPNGSDGISGTLDDDLRLQAGSPALDAGDSDAIAAGDLDLVGNTRRVDDPAADSGHGASPLVDMGAYERSAQAPIAAADQISTAEETPIVIPVLANDGSPVPSEDLRIVAVSPPSDGGAASIAGATVVYTPALNFSGISTFGYTVEDSAGRRAASNVTATVAAVNDQPRFIGLPLSTAREVSAYLYSIATSDVDAGDALTITAQLAPGWLKLVDNHNGTATLSGTPLDGDVGAHPIMLRVADRVGAATTQAFTITVSSINQPPIAAGDSITITEDTPIVIPVLANDRDPDAQDSLRITAVGSPPNGHLVVQRPSAIVYTPKANFSGRDTFWYAVGDRAGLTTSAPVTVIVVAANDPPAFVDQLPTTTVTAGATYSMTVAAHDFDQSDALTITTDFDQGDALTITADLLPGWLRLTDHGDGTATLNGTPSDADVGDYLITLRVTDSGAASDIQILKLSIKPASGQPPQLAISHAQARPGSTLIITGTNFLLNTQLLVLVNGTQVGSLNSGANGVFILALITSPNALPGAYAIAVRGTAGATTGPVSQFAETTYTLDRAAPLYEQTTGMDHTATVPAAILPRGFLAIFIPLIRR